MDDKHCSIQFRGQMISLDIQSVDYLGAQSVYKVTNDSHNLSFLPTLLQDALSNILPKEWLLPRNLVIKPKPSDPEAYYTFDVEGKVYSQLSHLQGQLIPRYYGVAKFRHGETTVDAHVIEQVDGTPLTHYREDAWTEHNFKTKIIQAYRRLSQERLIHGDAELRHIFAVGPRYTLILIDFGLATFCEDEKEADRQNKIDVDSLFRQRDR
jgi:hypothetical protein